MVGNQAFGSTEDCGAKPDYGVQAHWLDMVDRRCDAGEPDAAANADRLTEGPQC